MGRFYSVIMVIITKRYTHKNKKKQTNKPNIETKKEKKKKPNKSNKIRANH